MSQSVQNCRPKAPTIVKKSVLGEVRSRVQKHVEKVTLSNPLGRVLAYTRAQFSLFHSGPQKSPKWWPKAFEMEARSSQNAFQGGSKKCLKNIVILNAFESQKGDQHGVKIVINRGLGRALGLKGSLRGSGWPLGLNFG